MKELYLDKLLRRDAPMTTDELKRLLLDRRTRLPAVQFLLAWSTLQHVQGGDTWKSLLPLEIAESLESIMASEAQVDGNLMSEGKGRFHADTDMYAAFDSILTHWRRTTTYLMCRNYNINTPILSPDSRRYTISKIVDDLDIALSYLTSQAQDGTRTQDLEDLVEQGAKFGWLLFSQPSLWKFDWRCGDCSRERVEYVECNHVVFPALLQLSDKHGKALKVARQMSEVELMKPEMLRSGDESSSNSGTV